MVDMTNCDGYSILSVKIEEMDFVKTPKFTKVIQEKLEEVHFPNIIIDLENLYYIDSTGLSSLINISRKIRDNNNEMVVVCSTTKILQVFDIAKINTFFKIFDTMKSAEKYLKSKTK
jgi:anti-anti-sigma factor